MNKEKILILGSKPNLKIPSIDFKKIYSSNASAEIAKKYQQKINNIPHTCIVGAKNYLKLNEIKNRILHSKPDRLIIRSFIKKYSENFKNDFNKAYLTNSEQLKFQTGFLENGFLDIIISEFKYEITIYKKINYILKSIMNSELLGFSTGLFAALYALKENQNSEVVLCGIGMEGGDHYYGSGSMTRNRGRVDAKLFSKIKKKYLDRIFIFDDHINNKIKINKINSNKYFEIDEL